MTAASEAGDISGCLIGDFYCCVAVTSDGLHSWQNCNASPAVNCVSLTLSVTIIMFMCKLLKAAIKYSNYVKS